MELMHRNNAAEVFYYFFKAYDFFVICSYQPLLLGGFSMSLLSLPILKICQILVGLLVCSFLLATFKRNFESTILLHNQHQTFLGQNQEAVRHRKKKKNIQETTAYIRSSITLPILFPRWFRFKKQMLPIFIKRSNCLTRVKVLILLKKPMLLQGDAAHTDL